MRQRVPRDMRTTASTRRRLPTESSTAIAHHQRHQKVIARSASSIYDLSNIAMFMHNITTPAYNYLNDEGYDPAASWIENINSLPITIHSNTTATDVNIVFESIADCIVSLRYSSKTWNRCVAPTTATPHRERHQNDSPTAPWNYNIRSLQWQGFYKFTEVKKYDFIWPIEDENIWLYMTCWRWKYTTFINYKINIIEAKTHIKSINNDLIHPHSHSDGIP